MRQRRTRSKRSVRILTDLTPAKFACTFSASCPAVLKDEASGKYVIIGKVCNADDPGLSGRVGPDEMAVEITSEMLEMALGIPPSK